MVEFACGIPSLLMGQTLPNIATNVDCETMRHPVGVCVGITPFNFPAMVPLWMFPVALVCGNTFVLKPSEKVPLSAVRLGELLCESGLPEGVFNIVHGGKECVDALLTHPQVAAISFVGSTNVARYVYETGTKNGKRVQAAGGAKNHLIVMPDADIEQAAQAIQAAAFGCAGERCMAGSIAVPIGNIADPLVERLVEKAAKMTVGPTDGGPTFDMGPVITREHLDKVRRLSRHRQAGRSDLGARRAKGRQRQRLLDWPERHRPRQAGNARGPRRDFRTGALRAAGGRSGGGARRRPRTVHMATAPRSSRAAAMRPGNSSSTSTPA